VLTCILHHRSYLSGRSLSDETLNLSLNLVLHRLTPEYYSNDADDDQQ
jgi:hypothetical protein